MQEAADKLYSEAYLTLLLRTVSSDGISPRLAVELALVLRHADQQIVPATLVIEFTQAILTSVDPQRAINHLLRYLDNVPDIAAFWAAVVQYPEAFVEAHTSFCEFTVAEQYPLAPSAAPLVAAEGRPVGTVTAACGTGRGDHAVPGGCRGGRRGRHNFADVHPATPTAHWGP